MNELHYLESIIKQLHERASTKNLKSTDDIFIDWGELKFILEHASTNMKPLRLIEGLIHTFLREEREKIIKMLSEESHEKHGNPTSNAKQSVEICYICQKETTVLRNEQIAVLENSDQLSVKCLDCVFNQMKYMRAESEQLFSYRWFVKEKGLEEDFEYFYEEQKTNPQ